MALIPEAGVRRLSAQAQRLRQSAIQSGLLQRHRLDTLQAQLQAMDPRQVLERGYSWLLDSHGRALSRTDQFRSGQKVRAVLVDGHVDLTVDAPRQQG